VIAQADYYIDLHGGDMIEALVPLPSITSPVTRRSTTPPKRWPRHTASDHSGHNDVAWRDLRGRGGDGQAGDPHRGGRQGILDEPSTHIHIDGVLNVLKRFGGLPGTPAPAPSPTYYAKFVWVAAEQDCVYYPKVKVDSK